LKRISLIAFALAVGLLAAMRTAGDSTYWRRYFASGGAGAASLPASLIEPRAPIKGGDGGGAPQSTAADEGFEPAALQEAARQAQAIGAEALIVRRHGHVVLAIFAKGFSENSQINGGDLSGLPLGLAMGALVDDQQLDAAAALKQLRMALQAPAPAKGNPWSSLSRAQLRTPAPSYVPSALGSRPVVEFISQHVWQPLHAADAAFWGISGKSARMDCCMVARIEDWLRLGDVLLHQGSFEGERIASPGWVRRLVGADGHGRFAPVWIAAQRNFTGDEPPAARETLWVDLGPYARLWLVPQRQLSIFVKVNANNTTPASDTLIPNILIRGMVDQASLTNGPAALEDLVPGHP
jgi:hypothetical protein